MKTLKYIYAIVLLSSSLVLTAQYQNIRLTPVGTSGISEPSICMNPKNTDQIIAGSNLNKYYVSEDGGFNWTIHTLQSPEYGVWGDPCIIVDTAGDFYYFHLANPPVGSWIDRIVCQKFDFEEQTWDNGTYTGLDGTKAQDKEWAVVDSATNTIYVTWTQFDQYGTSDINKYSNIHFSKSVDGGETWTDALRINKVSGNCVDSDSTVEGAVPAVGPEGQVYVAWSGPEGIVFDRSLDSGETWLDDDIFINSQPGGWDMDIPGISRANGLPITCCDISNSEYRGTIYVNWADQRYGEEDTDIWISKSIDGGNTWSEALRVNDDPAGKQQFFTWMTIDQANGDIYIVFYDRRNYEGLNTDVFIAKSTDGGETFENFCISESPFLPYSTVFFGDYTNITAHNGRVRPIWARADGNQMSIWTAIIESTTDIANATDRKPVSSVINYPNPFKESTNVKFKIRKADKVYLGVVDIYGRNIATIINNEYREAGKYVETYYPEEDNVKPGVYYFTLRVGNTTENHKMIFVR